jgi:hypothetical protein
MQNINAAEIIPAALTSLFVPVNKKTIIIIWENGKL